MSDALSTVARMRLVIELGGLVREKLRADAAGGLAPIKRVALITKIAAALKRLGVGVKPVHQDTPEEAEAFKREDAPELPEQPRKSTAHLYEFDPNRKPGQRKKDNAAAISLLRQIDAGEVDAGALTDEQRATLAKYSGLGGNLEGADGLKGSAYEYYTPKPIADGAWSLLAEMGFTGGKVSDPCGGVGIFGATAPANVIMDVVELDETSGRINQLVNGGPGYSVTVSPFEAVASRTPDEQYDAVVTNVPFGDKAARGSNARKDPRYQSQSLEGYFILRSLEKLKPGGLACFIVPPRVVSGKGGALEKLRGAMSLMAEFMGAYRLPNSVFGTAAADTMTDIIVLRKFSRPVATKIDELREQSPSTLSDARVLWPEFIEGAYFTGEGRRYVLGEFQAKDPAKFRDIDRVINDASIADIAKLLRKFPGSRIDWAALNSTETEPIAYNDGDCLNLAGQTLQMRDGQWHPVEVVGDNAGKFDALGRLLGDPLRVIDSSVTWDEARAYVEWKDSVGDSLDVWDWLRATSRDLAGVAPDAQAAHFTAMAAGYAATEVMAKHADEAGFNFLEGYPSLSDAIRTSITTANRPAGGMSAKGRAAMERCRVTYSLRDGFSAVWRGDVVVDAGIDATLTPDQQIAALKYRKGTIELEVSDLRQILGEDFDPLKSSDWCVSGDGRRAVRADDYYTGNYAAFLRRLDAEIAGASGDLRDKLILQRDAAGERITRLDPGSLRYTLLTPFATLEDKAEFLRRFAHPAFVIAVDDETGGRAMLCDIKSPANETERQLKRVARYVNYGTVTTGTNREDAASNPELERRRVKMLRDMVARFNSQFDAWMKANPVIMQRLIDRANDPAGLNFNEVDDGSPVAIPGMNPDLVLHDYQNSFVRKSGRHFGGINGFAVGLGKSFSALAAVQYVQSISVKQKTLFVVPGSVMSNWRREAGRAYSSLEDCLFVGLNMGDDGKSSVDSSDYARDFNRILENRHRKVFCSLEAFRMIPLKDETVAAYQAFMQKADPTFEYTEKRKDNESVDADLDKLTAGTAGRGSIPFFEDMGIDSLVIDEAHCVPAGTLVDGRPIETIEAGEFVNSMNHDTGLMEMRRVSAVMSRPAESLAVVRLNSGQSLITTPDHGIYEVGRGYTPAFELSAGDVVQLRGADESASDGSMLGVLEILRADSGSGKGDSTQATDLLLGGVRSTGHRDDGQGCNVLGGGDAELRGVQQAVRGEGGTQVSRSFGGADNRFLREIMLDHQQVEDECQVDRIDEDRREAGEASLSTHAVQSPADAGGRLEELRHSHCEGRASRGGTKVSGWEWPRADGATSGAAGGTRGCLGSGACGNDGAERPRGGVSLHAGHCSHGQDDCCGGGREVASREGGDAPGREERRPSHVARVESVEIVERADRERFASLCPDGLVYDLTVEHNHNFFADGVLVHNCYKNSSLADFAGAKFLSSPEVSARGLDARAKAWYIRGLSDQADGVMPLTATAITNSPLEIYSMFALGIGEERVNSMMMGARGPSEFMNAVCDIEDGEEEGIDGQPRSTRIFRGLQNAQLLRGIIRAGATIRTAEDSGLALPGAQERPTKVALPKEMVATLELYRDAYIAAKSEAGVASRDAPEPTDEQKAALEQVKLRFGEPATLLANAFNLIDKMTKLILDADLDERATFYSFRADQRELADKVITGFNKLGKVEERLRPGPWTQDSAVSKGRTVKKDTGEVEQYLKVKVLAGLTEDGRIVIDTMDYAQIEAFEKVADKLGLDLDCAVTPKIAALLENFKHEEANPRSKTRRVKQIIFCDAIGTHLKLRRLIAKHCGVPLSAIAVVNGKSVRDVEAMQVVQDGFNAEEGNRFRTIIANKKAEVGVNYQMGTQAIHHLTIGWTPDSQVQRNGRGVRQGNTTSWLAIYHYDADGTFDSYKRRLTSVKGQWIDGLMADDGGDTIQISGDLGNEQYEQMIESLGDESKLQAIQERAAVKERLQRAESARARQVINLHTMEMQGAFVDAFDTAAKWGAAQLVKLFDLERSHEKLKAGRPRTADGVARQAGRLAEIEATIRGLRSDIEESVIFEPGKKLDAVISAPSFYSSAAKIREHVVRTAGYSVRGLNEGSTMHSDWRAEVDAATKMVGEAASDFVRVANQGQGGYPAEVLDAFRRGATITVDGHLYHEGMWFRVARKAGTTEAGTLLAVVRRGEGAVSAWRPGKVFAVADAVSMGFELITAGTPEYERALNEAAAHDDEIMAATPLAHEAIDSRLFGAAIPEVAARMKNKIRVKTNAASITVPAPAFPIPLREVPGMSSAALGLMKQQREVAVFELTDSGNYVVYERGTMAPLKEMRQTNAMAQELISRVDAIGGTITTGDLNALPGYTEFTRNSLLTHAAVFLREKRRTPILTEAVLATVKSIEELHTKALEIVMGSVGSLVEVVDLAEAEVFLAYTQRAALRDRERKLAAPEPAPTPTPAPAPTPEPTPAPVQSATGGDGGVADVASIPVNDRGCIAITGDTRAHKDRIKECALVAGRKAFWNGAKTQWEVPAKTWDILVARYPAAANDLQPIAA